MTISRWEIQFLLLLAATRTEADLVAESMSEFAPKLSRTGVAIAQSILHPHRRCSKRITEAARIFCRRADARTAEQETIR